MSRADLNVPTPELGPVVRRIADVAMADAKLMCRVRSDPVLTALHEQTLNTLLHVSLDFNVRDASYPHAYALAGPYPFRPTCLALEKAAEFFSVLETEDDSHEADDCSTCDACDACEACEATLLAEQRAVIDEIMSNTVVRYRAMRARLLSDGDYAKFPEFRSLVDYLDVHMSMSMSMSADRTGGNAHLRALRRMTLARLRAVRSAGLPYMATLIAVQRACEYYDVYHRASGSNMPPLYHSQRYEYYTHFLMCASPDHIMFPTAAKLGATDLLKCRGVPIGLLGINTDVLWVDGFHQTPFEFYVHDINHTRRMYQFMVEDAAAKSLDLQEYVVASDAYIRQTLIPAIAPMPYDDPVTRHYKRVCKIVLFEVLHEDAQPASPDAVLKALNRQALHITPFETRAGTTVTYLMEAGASTLAYVFRKLTHEFYDRAEARQAGIVAPAYRTRPHVVEATARLCDALGFDVPLPQIRALVATDAGFPEDFLMTLVRDIARRPGETPVLQEGCARSLWQFPKDREATCASS